MNITMDVLPTMKGAAVMIARSQAVALHRFAAIDMPAAADCVALLCTRLTRLSRCRLFETQPSLLAGTTVVACL